MAWIKKLLEISQKPERLVLGMMSGTSVDSIDVALCAIRRGGVDATVELREMYSEPYDPLLRETIRKFQGLTLREVAELHAAIGEAFATAALNALRHLSIPASSIDLVGSHGQTVYHHSGRAPRCTLQLGDGDRIAERTGLPVFCDFRARDVAAGGEGAPLTPYADGIFFKGSYGDTKAVLNMGGIANVTLLAGYLNTTVGFDTGPANAPLDRIASRLTNGALQCDLDGKLTKGGRVKEQLLRALIDRDTFITKAPPKSTGVETYGDEFVEEAIKMHGGCDADLLATMTEFVAWSIAYNLKTFSVSPVQKVIIAGGGARNPALVARLSEHLAPIKVVPSEEYGVPSGARECMAFALLANDALLGLPTGIPSITGVSRPVTLGKLCLPSHAL